jgi:hypothetical protein
MLVASDAVEFVEVAPRAVRERLARRQIWSRQSSQRTRNDDVTELGECSAIVAEAW